MKIGGIQHIKLRLMLKESINILQLKSQAMANQILDKLWDLRFQKLKLKILFKVDHLLKR